MKMTQSEIDSFNPTKKFSQDELHPGKIVYAGQFTLPTIVLGKIKDKDEYSLRIYNVLTNEKRIGTYRREDINPYWPITDDSTYNDVVRELKSDFNELIESNKNDDSLDYSGKDIKPIPIDDSFGNNQKL